MERWERDAWVVHERGESELERSDLDGVAVGLGPARRLLERAAIDAVQFVGDIPDPGQALGVAEGSAHLADESLALAHLNVDRG